MTTVSRKTNPSSAGFWKVAGLRGHVCEEASFCMLWATRQKVQGKHKVPFTESRLNYEPSPSWDSVLPMGLSILQNMSEDDGFGHSCSFTSLTLFLTQMLEIRSGSHFLTISYFLPKFFSCQDFLIVTLFPDHTDSTTQLHFLSFLKYLHLTLII